MIRRAFVLLLSLFSGSFYIFAQSQGEKLFKENNPSEAVQVLENEIANGIVSDNSYNFLGLGYYQLGEYEKSVKAFQKGIDTQSGNVKILAFNQGNSYFALKEYKAAVECYSRVLAIQEDFYEALLNRANSLLMGNQLRPARSDYAAFVEKNPENEQTPRIKELITAIDEELARREEEERLARELEKARWEQIDGSPEEGFYGPDGAEWERFEDDFKEADYKKKERDWERLESENIKKLVDKSDEKVTEDVNWESFDGAKSLEPIPMDSEKEETAFWESIDEKERELLKTLDAEGIEEYKRRKELLLEEARKEAEEKLKLSNGNSKEAYEELRKKRLDDLANSLQNTDVTNVSSGAENLIEYDMEGELD